MLLLQNKDIEPLLTIEECFRAQEIGLQDLACDQGGDRPPVHMWVPCERPDGYYRLGDMHGACVSYGVYAIRIKSDLVFWPGGEREDKYCVRPGNYCGLIFLFSTANGELLAILQDGYLQHMRVGSMAGLGAKYLARGDAKVLGMIGSGGMARTYLEAIAAVRRLELVKVYSPTLAHRESYAKEMDERFGIRVQAVASAEEAVKGSDIIATCTDALEPVLQDPDWIRPGMHVTTVRPSECDPRVVGRADLRYQTACEWQGWGMPAETRLQIAVGRPEEVARIPRGAHFAPFHRGDGTRDRDFLSLVDLIRGKVSGREDHRQVSFYRVRGATGLQFAAVAGHVYRMARERGVGRELPSEFFVQDISD
jgi:ornithine cyclodeaminase/alanine dehydrogenase-like protein (mu-crystallin family)